MQIETTQRTLHVFPPELEIVVALEGDRTVYKYEFVDGTPRTVTVEVRFHDLNGDISGNMEYTEKRCISFRPQYHEPMLPQCEAPTGPTSPRCADRYVYLE